MGTSDLICEYKVNLYPSLINMCDPTRLFFVMNMDTSSGYLPIDISSDN